MSRSFDMPGQFVISLDLELEWGIADSTTKAAYHKNIEGVRAAVPAMLRLFERYDVHATWATVGLLFFKDREAMLGGLPDVRPSYENPRLSAYHYLDELGPDEDADPLHFGISLVDQVTASAGQELATHTFSHYYCLEDGQTRDEFAADIEAAVTAAKARGIELRSIVFPRNQINVEYLGLLHDHGIIAYRGNPDAWMYAPRGGRENMLRRGARLTDSYLPLTRKTVHASQVAPPNSPMNIPASRFLRPYNSPLQPFEGMRLRRISSEMEQAARKRGLYHLWWHPHNFGDDLQANIDFLEQILETYQRLHRRFGMQSLTMAEVAEAKIEKARQVRREPAV